MARWGMPSSQKAQLDAATKRADKVRAKGKSVNFEQLLRMEPDGGTTNIRNTASKHWKRWLSVERRCVVPFTSFSEFNKAAGGAPLANLYGLPAECLVRARYFGKQYICSPMCRLTSGSRSNLLSWIKLPSKTTDNAGLEQPQGAPSIRGIEQHRLSCLRPRHLETSNTAIHRAAKLFQFFHGDCDDREAKQSRSNSEIT
jgi:hypothetical protein